MLALLRDRAKLCSDSSGTLGAQEERWRSESQAGWRSGGKGASKILLQSHAGGLQTLFWLRFMCLHWALPLLHACTWVATVANIHFVESYLLVIRFTALCVMLCRGRRVGDLCLIIIKQNESCFFEPLLRSTHYSCCAHVYSTGGQNDIRWALHMLEQSNTMQDTEDGKTLQWIYYTRLNGPYWVLPFYSVCSQMPQCGIAIDAEGSIKIFLTCLLRGILMALCGRICSSHTWPDKSLVSMLYQ